MYLGDNILREGIIEHAKKFKENKSDASIMLTEVKNPQQFGILEACKGIKPSWRSELEITDAIQWLIDNGYEVSWTKVNGWWKDTGKAEDIFEANRLILDDIQKSEILGGGRIIESLIGKEVKIRRKANLPNGRKLIVGYHSEIVG